MDSLTSEARMALAEEELENSRLDVAAAESRKHIADSKVKLLRNALELAKAEVSQSDDDIRTALEGVGQLRSIIRMHGALCGIVISGSSLPVRVFP